MGRIGDALGAAWRTAKKDYAQRTGGARFQAVGRLVRCPHCGNDRFESREALLNTTGASLIQLDWLNKSAVALVCSDCSIIVWFAASPERLSE
jgi:predicted nucleic-acid-binding Zn-ribbon protein